MSERPTEITILTLIITIVGIIGIIIGIWVASTYAAPNLTNLSSTWLLIWGIIAIIGGAGYLISGIGLWMLKNWGRILILILTIPTIMGSFLMLFVFPFGTVMGAIGFVLSVIIILYLTGGVSTIFL